MGKRSAAQKIAIRCHVTASIIGMALKFCLSLLLLNYSSVPPFNNYSATAVVSTTALRRHHNLNYISSMIENAEVCFEDGVFLLPAKHEFENYCFTFQRLFLDIVLLDLAVESAF